MSKSAAFPEVEKIEFKGPKSRNPLAFRHYNASELVEGKSMKDHLRFAVAYWHTFRGTGSDPFGPGTMVRHWEGPIDTVENAINRVHVAFEFIEKLGVPFYCFHDRDVAPEGTSLAETNKNLDAVVRALKAEQQRSGIKLLWGTANLFSNRRYMHGAATSCNADAFAFAAAQVKKAIEVTKELGGAGYVFWGGREGYQTLWNTDMKRELDHLARFMHMAVDYAKQIGFTGQFYFEPKPKEPTKHQYDFDAAACLNFLRTYGLEKHVKLNIETNHATLAGHSMQHELEYAAMQGFLGSIDANFGDLLLGWDTDQFPTDIYLTTQVMLVLLKYRGFTTGGLNFDAKVRRESFEPIDLFHAHVGGMDAFARGLKIAAAIRADGLLAKIVKDRYASWDTGIGAEIESGRHDFLSLEQRMLSQGDITPNQSGRQEMIENLINSYL
jgi:xylose isomerase